MDKKNQLKDIRQFAITLALILAVLGGIQYHKHRIDAYPWWLGASGVVLLAAVINPRLLLPVFIVFTKVGHALGWFNTRLILSVIYLCVLTPIALIRKMFGKAPLPKKVDRQAKSYWVVREERRAKKEKLSAQF